MSDYYGFDFKADHRDRLSEEVDPLLELIEAAKGMSKRLNGLYQSLPIPEWNAGAVRYEISNATDSMDELVRVLKRHIEEIENMDSPSFDQYRWEKRPSTPSQNRESR